MVCRKMLVRRWCCCLQAIGSCSALLPRISWCMGMHLITLQQLYDQRGRCSTTPDHPSSAALHVCQCLLVQLFGEISRILQQKSRTSQFWLLIGCKSPSSPVAYAQAEVRLLTITSHPLDTTGAWRPHQDRAQHMCFSFPSQLHLGYSESLPKDEYNHPVLMSQADAR